MTSRRFFFNFALAGLALAVAPWAHAASAEEFVRAKQSALMNLVKDGKPDALVDRVFDEVLDYRGLAEAALGEHWAGRTDAEREEFTKLLAKLVRSSYRRNLKKTLGYEIAYKGTESGKDGEIVRTTARSKTHAREEPLSIDYVVRNHNAGPRIVDVVTEGSSMVGNYRASFARIIKKSGFAELLKKMRKKAEAGSADAD